YGIPWASIIIAHGPASGATNGIRRRDPDARDVRNAPQIQLPAPDDEGHRNGAADQSAPEHEAGAAPQHRDVLHQDHVVDLRAQQAANDGGEDQITNRFGVMAAARQLALADHLRDGERQQHRDAESGEGKATEVDDEGVMNDHAVTSPGNGAAAYALRSSGASSPRAK